MESNLMEYIQELVKLFEGEIYHITNKKIKINEIKNSYFTKGESLCNSLKKTKAENEQLELIFRWEYLAIQNSILSFNSETLFDDQTKNLLLYPIKSQPKLTVQSEISFYIFKYLFDLTKNGVNPQKLISFIQTNSKSIYNCLRVKFLKKDSLRNNIYLFNYYTDLDFFDQKAKNPLKHRQMFYLMINELMKKLSEKEIEEFIQVLLNEDSLFKGSLTESNQEQNESRLFIIECLLGNINKNNETLKNQILTQLQNSIVSQYIIVQLRAFHVLTSCIKEFPNDIINNQDLYDQIVETKDETNETLKVLGYFAISLLYEKLDQKKKSILINEEFKTSLKTFYEGYFNKKCSLSHLHEASLINLGIFFKLETKIPAKSFFLYNLFLQQYDCFDSKENISSLVDNIVYMINESKDKDYTYEQTMISLNYFIEQNANDFNPDQDLFKKIESILNDLKTENQPRKQRCLYLVLFSLGMRVSNQNLSLINDNYKDVMSSFTDQTLIFNIFEFISFWIILFEGKNLNISDIVLETYIEIIKDIQNIINSFETNILLFALGLLIKEDSKKETYSKLIKEFLNIKFCRDNKISFSEIIIEPTKIKAEMIFPNKWKDIIKRFLKLKIEKNKEILDFIEKNNDLALNDKQKEGLQTISKNLD